VNLELLKAALDAIEDAVVVCSPGGLVVYANRAARTAMQIVPGTMHREDVVAVVQPATVREQVVSGGTVLVLGRSASVVPLAEGERLAIEGALRDTNWQLSLAAQRLGISRTTLWRRLKSYGLRRPASHSPEH
jgi:transcriptional regulator with PAS, ATPase and Fis domain